MLIRFEAPDVNMENAFWAFVKGRQDAWYRRFVLKLPRAEWTADPILQRTAFPNVYRELDPGTQFAVEAVLEDCQHEEYWQAIAHLMTYRLFNLAGPYQLVAPLVTDAAHGCDRSLAAIGVLIDDMLDRKVKAFGAGTPAPGRASDGRTEDETAGQVAAELLGGMFCMLSNLETSLLSGHCSLRQVRDYFSRQRRYGARRAFTCAYDMTLPLLRKRGRPLAEVNMLEWVQVEGGPADSLARMGVAGPEAALVRAVRHMHAKQTDALHPLGFQWLRDGRGDAHALSMGSLARCLAMFALYTRLQADGARRNGWSPSEGDGWRPAHITLPVYGPWREPWAGRVVAC